MIQVKTDEDPPMLVINMYNTKDSTLINDFTTFLQTHLRHHRYDAIVMVGDFNLHHPLWNPPHYDIHDHEAEDLIDLMATNGLNLILLPGTITFPRSNTTLDLVWGNAQMEEKVLRCKVADNHDHGSDHFPIITTLDLKPERMEEAPIYNFDRTNWDLLKAKVIEFLPSITDEPTSPPMVDQINWQRISRRHLEKQLNTQPHEEEYAYSVRDGGPKS